MIKNIGELIDEINLRCRERGIPYAYRQFKDAQSLPFVAYMFAESNNFHADSKAFYKKGQFNVELYVDKKTPDLEQVFESIFDENLIPYKKYESFLKEEKMFEVLWELELEENYG